MLPHVPRPTFTSNFTPNSVLNEPVDSWIDELESEIMDLHIFEDSFSLAELNSKISFVHHPRLVNHITGPLKTPDSA